MEARKKGQKEELIGRRWWPLLLVKNVLVCKGMLGLGRTSLAEKVKIAKPSESVDFAKGCRLVARASWPLRLALPLQ